MAWDETDARRFGLTLRRLRVDRGLSQESLAYRAGITKNAIQLLEAGRPSGRKEAHGTSNPRFSTLAGIAEVLGLKVSALLAEADL